MQLLVGCSKTGSELAEKEENIARVGSGDKETNP